VKSLQNVSALYQPCAGRANTTCLPRFAGNLSSVAGFCTANRPGATTTVGQVCDPNAGVEASSALCGPDAACVGGQCQAICDASKLGQDGTPGCAAGQTCVSPQGVDLVADFQYGGCGDSCDPFADIEHSGCWKYCGGPPARCNWIVGNPSANTPRGYCGPALESPVPNGQACTVGAIDPCEAGSKCLLSADQIHSFCTHLCDPAAGPGAADACPAGMTCTAFASLMRSGYCM
jgi:hypothetical protein